MGIIAYFRQKRKAYNNQKATTKISAVEKLIESKFMLIDTKNYQVAMLDNLWALYPEGEKQINFCESLKYYCDIQNAYKGYKVNKKAKLLISLKYENNDVLPYAYFDGKNITLYREEKEN
ncbi:hypothetical protein JGH11_04580 [Dysgonomonas sp. Marseille-P4677]|uniref:hypothetical protein n=1 Tax=Dysgonomonas sp. Marseille-P4677 TaxID=2364790 RepID=UPI0019120C36|nr:hypothetical protein [Dysgonomonas sp. Marseille-P4677]MBK5720143.1 hypothetical protein [Dysgonomonas sp. Marseille-P4677]